MNSTFDASLANYCFYCFFLDFRPLSKSILTARAQLAGRYYTRAGEAREGRVAREKTSVLIEKYTKIRKKHFLLNISKF